VGRFGYNSLVYTTHVYARVMNENWFCHKRVREREKHLSSIMVFIVELGGVGGCIGVKAQLLNGYWIF